MARTIGRGTRNSLIESSPDNKMAQNKVHEARLQKETDGNSMTVQSTNSGASHGRDSHTLHNEVYDSYEYMGPGYENGSYEYMSPGHEDNNSYEYMAPGDKEAGC